MHRLIHPRTLSKAATWSVRNVTRHRGYARITAASSTTPIPKARLQKDVIEDSPLPDDLRQKSEATDEAARKIASEQVDVKVQGEPKGSLNGVPSGLPNDLRQTSAATDEAARTIAEEQVDVNVQQGTISEDITRKTLDSAVDAANKAAAELGQQTSSGSPQEPGKRRVPPPLTGNSSLLDMLEGTESQKAEASPQSGGGAGGSGLGGSGGGKKSEYKSTGDVKRERMANVFLSMILLGALGGVGYLGREFEFTEPGYDSAPKGYSPTAFTDRLKQRYNTYTNYYTEPAFEKLLPDPLPEPYQRKYTLVLDLDDLLIHSEWSREHGWRTAKRPGVDYFLSYLSQYYEIVIFTTQYNGTAIPIITKLDPYRSSLSASLFRESCKYQDGKFIKDLDYMNRPLERIIVMDTNPDAVSLHPQNAIVLKPWTGQTGDKELVAYIPFLEYLAAVEVSDVRPVIKAYEGTHIPTEFLRKEEELRQKIRDSRKRPVSSSWFGRSSGGPAAGAEEKVELFSDQQRARAQAAYAEYQKYLKDNGEKMLAEEKARETEMLAGMKTSLSSFITEGIPKPPVQ